LPRDEPFNTTILYHPLQFHAVVRAVRYLRTPVLVGDVLQWSTEHLAAFQSTERQFMQAAHDRLRVEIGGWYGLALLLLHVQDIYLPRIRGFLKGSPASVPSAHSDWVRWRREFDPHEALQTLGLDVAYVQTARQAVFHRGRAEDPLDNWAHLARLARFRKRSELRGEALLAQDYYDIADILGYFLEDLTGQRQVPTPDMWDARGTEIQVSLYGAPLMSRDRKALTRYLGAFGLVPQARAALLTEGETEARFFPRLCKEILGVPLEEAGIWHHPLRGANMVRSKALRRLLGHLKWDGTLVHVIVDNDPEVSSQIDDLVREGLVRRDLCTVWEQTFPDEFPSELVGDALCDALIEKHPQAGLGGAAVAVVREASIHAQDRTGLGPFEEPLARLDIRLKDLEPALGSALAGRVASGIRSGGISWDFPPVRRLIQVLNNAALPWHEWSGFAEDQPTLP
jgi:hypothetical protein